MTREAGPKECGSRQRTVRSEMAAEVTGADLLSTVKKSRGKLRVEERLKLKGDG